MTIDDGVKTVIKAMGYTFNAETDTALLELETKKAEQRILTMCNISEIPEALNYVLIYRIAGEFLSVKYGAGAKFDGVDFSAAGPLKSIQEGDTTVAYATGEAQSDSEKLRRMIRSLKEYGASEVAQFRCLHW